MGALTEQDIFSCMQDNLRSAIQHCEDLARIPLPGLTYDAFRKELRLIEGACRQASAWRSDTRWLPIGMLMEKAHQTAGNWLRGAKLPDGTKTRYTEKQRFANFTKLADNLRQLYRLAEDTRTRKTGVTGMILPPEQKLIRQNRPVPVSNNGLILPPTYAGAA